MRREDNHRTEVDVQEEADTVRDRDGRLPNGTVIEGYVIDGVLGKGGMGIVYSATHKMIGKRAAIKVLRMEVSQNPMHLQRFIQEARAVNAIGHPNIIDIFDFGQLPDGRAFHLMDLMTGESLRQRLRRGPLHPSEAANVIEAVASALMAAHDKGFIHRDLKPDNIYLIPVEGDFPDVKLLDFGLAKLMPEAGTAAFITKTGVMLGTPEYMSPEQARGEPIDYRTDVYALGICMFEILAGERPFPRTGDAFSTLLYHAEEMPPSIGAAVPDLLPEMVQLVDTMLKKDPYARPSLAAVRTVIKRLRTTKLPTHSIAGQELASYSNPNIAAINSGVLGASPLVPSTAQVRPHPPSDLTANMSAPYAHYSAHSMTPPPSNAPTPEPPRTSGLVPPSRPAQLTPEQQDNMRTTPRVPSIPPINTPSSAPSNMVPPSRSPGDDELMRTVPRSGSSPGRTLTADEHEQMSTLPRRTPPTAPSDAAPKNLGAGVSPHQSTTLGVAPPPKPASSARLSAREKAPKKVSSVWLIIGALLFIGAGVALAFVLVG
ncbi:MAG: protein kinase domain-containing protein [Kofleriaceae bacterium]